MPALKDTINRMRRFQMEHLGGLRPNYPPVSIEINRDEMVLARLRRRRGKLTLEAHQSRQLPEGSVGASIIRPNLAEPTEVAGKVKELLEVTGTKPGRISVVLPDNLAKIALVTLPERPASRRHLTELIRFKLRRSVPFRLEDSVLSYQLMQGGGKEATVLAALMLRSVLEQYERVFEAAGARPGLVDLCTPNLLNLCRPAMQQLTGGDGEGGGGGDVALLNCAQTYFSLLILRGGRLVFYRCKSYAVGEDDLAVANGVMTRELNTSMSYYREKLDGEGIGAIFVRSVAKPMDEMVSYLRELAFDRVIAVDPAAALSLPEGMRLDSEVGQRIAPAVGSAAGRRG